MTDTMKTSLAGNLPFTARLVKQWCRRIPLQRGKLRLVRWASNRCLANGVGPQNTRLNCGFELECDLSKLMQQQLFFMGTYHVERQQLLDWNQRVRSSRLIMDIGANVGIYSLEAKAVNPTASVLAFEPTPEWAVHLRHTIARNGICDLEVLQTAVGRAAGQAFLQICDGNPSAGAPANEGISKLYLATNSMASSECQPYAAPTLLKPGQRPTWPWRSALVQRRWFQRRQRSLCDGFQQAVSVWERNI